MMQSTYNDNPRSRYQYPLSMCSAAPCTQLGTSHFCFEPYTLLSKFLFGLKWFDGIIDLLAYEFFARVSLKFYTAKRAF